MIDLHTHTSYSDGTYTVKQLLEEAQKAGISILSITDHNTVNAYKEMAKNDYTDLFTGKIVTGAEFEVMFDGAKIELLGFDFDYNKIDEWINDEYDANIMKANLNNEFELMVNACKKNNVKIDDIQYEASMGWPINHIFKSLKKYEENRKLFNEQQWSDKTTFFRNCTCNKNFPVYIDFTGCVPDAKSISDRIRAAGGKVFLPHLFLFPVNEYIAYLDMLRQENIIDGIEVYHCSFSDEQTNILKDYCNKYNLLMSGGTDFHGHRKPDRKIGVGYGNLNINEKLVENWI